MRGSKALLGVQIYDGARRQLTKPVDQILVTLRNGYQKVLHRRSHASPEIDFSVPFRNSLADRFTVLAWQDGAHQSGFYPITVSPEKRRDVKLMLVPENPLYDFGRASWQALEQNAYLYGWITGSFREKDYAAIAGESAETPETNKLATLLNITEAVRRIDVKGEQAGFLLNDFSRLYDPSPPAPASDGPVGPVGFREDRVYVWVDERVHQVISTHPDFKEEPRGDHRLPGNGAKPKISYKQQQAGEANLQFTFYEQALGVSERVLELDMDYYKDKAAHFLLEFVPHKVAKVPGLGFLEKRTDPRRIYTLRWTADHNDGRTFDPLYTLGRV